MGDSGITLRLCLAPIVTEDYHFQLGSDTVCLIVLKLGNQLILNPFSRKRLSFDAERTLADELIKRLRLKDVFPVYQLRVSLVIDPKGDLVKNRYEKDVCFTKKIPIALISKSSRRPEFAILSPDTHQDVAILLKRAGLPYEYAGLGKTTLSDADDLARNIKLIASPEQARAAKLFEKTFDLVDVRSERFSLFQEVALDEIIEYRIPNDYEESLIRRQTLLYANERLSKRYPNWDEMRAKDDPLALKKGGAYDLQFRELESIENSAEHMRFVKKRVNDIQKREMKRYKSDCNFIDTSSIDIVISSCAPESLPLLLIEYDGGDHLEEEQIEKDRRKERLSAMAGLPLIRITLRSLPYFEEDYRAKYPKPKEWEKKQREHRFLFLLNVVLYLVQFMETVESFEPYIDSMLAESALSDPYYFSHDQEHKNWKFLWAWEEEHKRKNNFHKKSEEMWQQLKSQSAADVEFNWRPNAVGTSAEVTIGPRDNSRRRIYQTPSVRLSGTIGGIFNDTTLTELEELFTRRHAIEIALEATRTAS